MVQRYFAFLDENKVVLNILVVNDFDSMLEYSVDQSITNNYPIEGATYDSVLNAFIPPKPEETYIFSTTTYKWEPDPSKEYDIDGKTCRWSPKTQGWILLENWSDEEHL